MAGARAMALVLGVVLGAGGAAWGQAEAPDAAAPAAAKAAEGRFADWNGRKVYYLDSGGDAAEAFVLIHGWASDHSFLQPQFEELREHGRVLSIDLPGHGRSEQPETHTMDAYADAIAAAMDDAKLTGAVLIGHSNGVPTIRQFYRRHGDRVLGLVAIDGALREVFPRAMVEGFLAQLEGENYQQMMRMQLGMMLGTSGISDEQKRQVEEVMFKTPQETLVQGLRAGTDPAVLGEDKVEAPLLVINAVNPMFQTEGYDDYVRQLGPDVELQVWEGVSHFLMMEQPARFNAEVLRFCRERELVVGSGVGDAAGGG